MNAALGLIIIKQETDSSTGYCIVGIIALLLFGYLMYSLIKPEKF
jgi:K+-transporting ATPase KdpF subunit